MRRSRLSSFGSGQLQILDAEAIDRNKVTRMHRIVVCLQGEERGAQACYVTLSATQQADEKVSRLVTLFREIA